MADPQVLNTNADLDGNTLETAENAYTITGLKTFDRDPSAPFAVTASSAVVPNLDADKLDGKEAAAFMLLDGTQSMTAALPLGATGQIQFPATQNASAGVNVLDDYEEGTLTLVMASSGGGAATYSEQVGRYVKIGKVVNIWMRIHLATKGTLGAGSITLTGLPYASINVVGVIGGLFIMYFSGMTTPISHMSGIVQPNSTTVTLYYVAAVSTGVTEVLVSDIGATFDMGLFGSYITES